MSTLVHVNTYTHSVTYATEKLMMSLKNIIVASGLSSERLTEDWSVLTRGIRTWLDSQDLEGVVLEVYDRYTDKLVGRWDFEIAYGLSGDGGFWVDTDDIRYHILKSGRWPSACDYRIVTQTKAARPDVAGWSKATLRSTDGFIRQSIGTTIDANGSIRSSASYWRQA